MTKDDIFKASLKIVALDGVEGLSMRKISNEVGCNVSSLYNHFSDKEKLLNEMFLDSYWRLQSDASIIDLSDHLRDFFMNAINYKDDFLFVKKYYSASFINEDTNKELRKSAERKVRHLEKILESNNVNKDSVKHVYLMLIGTAVELLQQDEISNEDIDMFVNIICYGIKIKEERQC